MQVKVHFFSYFKDLTGCSDLDRLIREGQTLRELLDELGKEFPKLAPMRKSTLVAVGVDYQKGDYQLKDGDEVSLFPPVQGG